MGIQYQQSRRRHVGAGWSAACAGAVKRHALDTMHGRHGHLMVPAKIGNRGGDAIFSRTQPHTSQQDQTSATLDGGEPQYMTNAIAVVASTNERR